MKKHSILLFIGALCPLAVFALLLSKFDGVLATVGGWIGLHSDQAYQNAAYVLVILLYICAMAGALLLPTALYYLQYRFTPLAALRFATRRFASVLITLPMFVMRFGGVDSWLPYLTDEGQIANPLYHSVLWSECAEWGALVMVIVVIFWGCLLAMNLFGSLPYGYVAANIGGALCLIPMAYLTLDYAAVLRGQNVLLTVLVVVFIALVAWIALQSKEQNLPPLRPFFAEGEANEQKWKE